MKRKKLLTLLVTSSLLISGAAVFAATSASGLGTLDTRASEVQGSIVFSKATGDAYKIDDYTFSVSGKTSLGATYYAVSHNNSDAFDTDLVAKFGGTDPSTDVQYVHFSDNKEGTGNFEFQGITGIKVTTKSSTSQTLYAYWSTTGGDWDWNSSNYNSVSASSNPEKVTFSSPRKFLALKGYVSYAREITSIELFYECSTGGDPGEKTIESIAPDWIAGVKQNYVLGDEFVPAPIKVTYSDSSSETITEGASFGGYNLSETGQQTVTVLYGGKETSYKITVRPSATARDLTYVGFSMFDYEYHPTSEFLKSESVLPAYAEPGETVYITTVFKDAYMLQGFYEEGETSIYTDGDTSWFVMPSRDIQWEIAYTANTYKNITYTFYDADHGYAESEASDFLDVSKSTMPKKAEPASTVNLTLDLLDGYEIRGLYANDGEEEVEVTGTYSFTMPGTAVFVDVVFGQIPVLESMYVKSPKTKYAVGDSFVMPKVIGVYNTGEAELTVTADNFSGFDSSAVVESQTITVSYPGIADVTYTITIVAEMDYLDCTFKIAQSSSTDYKLTFKDDGTGEYFRYYNSTKSWTIAFEYEYDKDTGGVTITLDPAKITYSMVNNFANGYRLVQANSASGLIQTSNSTGFVNAGGNFEIDMVRVSAGVFSTEHRTFTLE